MVVAVVICDGRVDFGSTAPRHPFAVPTRGDRRWLSRWNVVVLLVVAAPFVARIRLWSSPFGWSLVRCGRWRRGMLLLGDTFR